MKNSEYKLTSFVKMLCMLILSFVFVFSLPFTAYAFDDGYINSYTYWNGEGEIKTVESNGFNGMLKYILDDKNGCAYFYLTFADSRFEEGMEENISLNFIISNKNGGCSFSLCKNGVTSDAENVVKNSFYTACNFEQLKGRHGGGEILAGFEFRNNEDKKLKNTITCTYTNGRGTKAALLKNMPFDMTVNTTEKTTVQKITAQKTTKNHSTGNKDDSATDKTAASNQGSAKAKKESSTKFTPSRFTATAGSSKSKSKRSSRKSETTKFSPFDSDNTEEVTTAKAESGKSDKANKSNNTENTLDTYRRGDTKTVAGIAAAFAASGLFFVIYGAFGGKKRKNK